MNELHCKSCAPGFSLAQNKPSADTVRRCVNVTWSRQSGRLGLRMYCEAGRGFRFMLLCGFMCCFLNESFHVKDATVNKL